MIGKYYKEHSDCEKMNVERQVYECSCVGSCQCQMASLCNCPENKLVNRENRYSVDLGSSKVEPSKVLHCGSCRQLHVYYPNFEFPAYPGNVHPVHYREIQDCHRKWMMVSYFWQAYSNTSGKEIDISKSPDECFHVIIFDM